MKKKKDDKRLIKVLSVFAIVVFGSSVFIAFLWRDVSEEVKTFHLTIQIKDYTNPLRGDVVLEENMTVSEVLVKYGIVINETCVTTDYEYCNDETFIWNVYVNNIPNYTHEYIPEDKDRIVFKYERSN